MYCIEYTNYVFSCKLAVFFIIQIQLITDLYLQLTRLYRMAFNNTFAWWKLFSISWHLECQIIIFFHCLPYNYIDF
jgi:hypothetical protein